MTTHPWQKRIVGHADVDPLMLKAHPKNFRTHANQQRRLMEAALDELGHVGEIVVNQRSGRILNGHLRVELAIGRAEATVPVTWVDVSDEEELVILAFFDSIGEQARIDAEKLRANFASISSERENLRTVIADWAASFAVTILPAKPAQAPAPVAPALVAAPAAPAVAAAPAATARIAVAPQVEVMPAAVAGAPFAIRAALPIPEPAAADVVPLPVVTATPAHIPAIVEATLEGVTAPAPEPVLEQPAAEAVEEPVDGGLPVDEMVLDGDENPFAAMLPEDLFAAALAEDHRVVVAEPVAIAEAVEKATRGKSKKKDKPVTPPARTHALVKVGEYDQEIPLSVFTPWFNALVSETGGDGFAFMNVIKTRLGIVA